MRDWAFLDFGVWMINQFLLSFFCFLSVCIRGHLCHEQKKPPMDIKEGGGSDARLGSFMRFLFFFSNWSSRVNGPGAIVDAGDILALFTVL